MLRASGTVPKISVMVESKDKKLNESIAENLVLMIKKVNDEV